MSRYWANIKLNFEEWRENLLFTGLCKSVWQIKPLQHLFFVVILIKNDPKKLWCQTVRFIMMVPNCLFLLSWRQIVRAPNCPVPNCPVPNCPTTGSPNDVNSNHCRNVSIVDLDPPPPIFGKSCCKFLSEKALLKGPKSNIFCVEIDHPPLEISENSSVVLGPPVPYLLDCRMVEHGLHCMESEEGLSG